MSGPLLISKAPTAILTAELNGTHIIFRWGGPTFTLAKIWHVWKSRFCWAVLTRISFEMRIVLSLSLALFLSHRSHLSWGALTPSGLYSSLEQAPLLIRPSSVCYFDSLLWIERRDNDINMFLGFGHSTIGDLYLSAHMIWSLASKRGNQSAFHCTYNNNTK